MNRIVQLTLAHYCASKSIKPKKEKKEMTQHEAIITVWQTIPYGQFILKQFEIKVENLLKRNNRGISGSGLTAAMRKLRGDAKKEFNYSVLNGNKSLYKKIPNKYNDAIN